MPQAKNFRDACNTSLDILVERKCAFMLADNTQAKIVKPEDLTWMNEQWFPAAYEAGYRGSAVIVSKDIFRDISVKKIVNELDKGKFTVQFFTDLESALDWLKTLLYIDDLGN